MFPALCPVEYHYTPIQLLQICLNKSPATNASDREFGFCRIKPMLRKNLLDTIYLWDLIWICPARWAGLFYAVSPPPPFDGDDAPS